MNLTQSINQCTYVRMYLYVCTTDVRRQVEVDRFLAELRRDVVEAGSSLTEEQRMLAVCLSVCVVSRSMCVYVL